MSADVIDHPARAAFAPDGQAVIDLLSAAELLSDLADHATWPAAHALATALHYAARRRQGLSPDDAADATLAALDDGSIERLAQLLEDRLTSLGRPPG